jgi:hypothetical protein|tara:strand:+ start:302 stop:445 length:144 start_codon:yes stop_codon:yes gene_type:complete
MNIEEALNYIRNAKDYWAEESDYDKKEQDVKKTDEAFDLIVKLLKKG